MRTVLVEYILARLHVALDTPDESRRDLDYGHLKPAVV